MTFNDTYSSVDAQLSALRHQMDDACRQAIKSLARDMFAECPAVGMMFWVQHYDTGTGELALTNMQYGPASPFAQTNVRMLTQSSANIAVDQGPPQVVAFAKFLDSVKFHLYCAHGSRSIVVMTRDGMIQSFPWMA